MGKASDGATINQSIVIYAEGKLGKTVGRGECWDLAENALQHAGATTSRDLGPITDDADYVWGDKFNDPKDAVPGDIIQFRDWTVSFEQKTIYSFRDGTKATYPVTERPQYRPHHTAIVRRSIDGHGVLLTYEQHVLPLKDKVQRKELYTRDTVLEESGIEDHVNPVTKKKEPKVPFQRVTTVTVQGTMWLYHPKRR
jgi:hypothetical protein